tara:strand:- start:1038 stop:2585 length:1548 start_codon:yes stop_codon:yes gene_type:complete
MNPSQAKSIPELVELAAKLYGDKISIEDQDKSLSFKQLHEESDRVFYSLLSSGINQGDRVGIWAPNQYEWILAAIGILKVGAILVPVNTRLKGEEAGYIFEKSSVKLLFTMENFLGINYAEILDKKRLKNLKKIIFFDKPSGEGSWSHFLDTTITKTQYNLSEPYQGLIADIIFTSGTTGNPKGVMVSHNQNMRVFESWSRHVGLKEGDRYLIVNPFFHTFGYKAGWLACLMRGAVIIPHQIFEADSVLQSIQDKKINVLPGPPALYQSILSSPNFTSFNISSLELAITGAASIPVQLIKDMEEIMGFQTILTAYGLTETTGVVTMCSPGDDPELIANTSGKAIEGVEVKCVDRSGREVPKGEPGEVYVRGYNVMLGYLEDEKQTKEAINPEGWLKTGDIGVMNPSGYLKITDRIKDMFIVGGFNTYPAEVENILAKHKDIISTAVIGVPDDRLGEVGKAFVVLKENAKILEEDLVNWCKEHMANYKVPREVVFVKQLPLNASGKVMKYKLRKDG